MSVFLAAAFLHAARLDPEDCLPLLREGKRRAFSFQEQSANWRGWSLSLAEIERARAEFALSYGSCSFLEPTDELKGMNLL